MARLLLPIMTVALAMATGVLAQEPSQACPSGYGTSQIPTFDLINLSIDEIDQFLADRKFVDLVYDCFRGINCQACTPTARQLLVLLPWLFTDCQNKASACNEEQRQRAGYIANAIQKRYRTQYQTILQTFV